MPRGASQKAAKDLARYRGLVASGAISAAEFSCCCAGSADLALQAQSQQRP
ncbi:hypothetical protein G7B21_29060 [Klebsiella pneumoniae]|nr:hypothetical protein [Klebsiella pneumoniae]